MAHSFNKQSGNWNTCLETFGMIRWFIQLIRNVKPQTDGSDQHLESSKHLVNGLGAFPFLSSIMFVTKGFLCLDVWSVERGIWSWNPLFFYYNCNLFLISHVINRFPFPSWFDGLWLFFLMGFYYWDPWASVRQKTWNCRYHSLDFLFAL